MNNARGRKKVFVMMSGGVDSSVAAALLQKQCLLVTGVFMKNWSKEGLCQWVQDERDARRVAAKLDIPFYVLDFEREYRELVFKPFLGEIRKGRTPNPDVFCNEYIKFGVFLERALKLGTDFVATGHYARIKKSYQLEAISYKLVKARDEDKDQTYFLYRLNQFQLSKTLFPIGEYAKSEVRAMAKEWGLPTYNKPDSQGICFVGEEPFEKFLARYIPQKPGVIVDRKGRTLGQHRGVSFYTIGQRQGLGIGGVPEPLFVAQKDARANTITAVTERDPLLYTQNITVSDIHWISGKKPIFPLRCQARIRYRQELQHCIIKQRAGSRKLEAASLKLNFSEAQRAVTPGQSVVFYRGDEVLGGGIID